MSTSYLDFKRSIPTRNSFIPKDKYDAVEALIRKQNPLPFLPSYLYETTTFNYESKEHYAKIVLNGIFPDGRRANVLLEDFEPYFEVRIPHESDPLDETLRGKDFNEKQYIAKIVNIIKREKQTTPSRSTIINAKPFKWYRNYNCKFIRFYYNNLKSRSAAINLMRKHSYETATDDLGSYYRVLSRDNLIPFATWAVLKAYEQTTIKNIKGTVFRVSINDYARYNDEPVTGFVEDDFRKERTMSVCWDIETWSRSGDLPKPENVDDRIFCISLTYQWINEKEPFLKQVLCDLPAHSTTKAAQEAKHKYQTIVCGNETNMLKCFADSIGSMKPDFIFGFNDSDYDWPWLINRARQTNGLLTYIGERLDAANRNDYTDESILNWNYKLEKVKIEATTYAEGYTLAMHGYIASDVRTIYRKLYPTAEQTNLKWFLKANNLGSKEDMPISVLFRIYGEMLELSQHPLVIWKGDGSQTEFQFKEYKKNNENDDKKDETNQLVEVKQRYDRLLAEMADINYYCVIDAQRCHDLVRIRNIVLDNREVADIAYVSLGDAFFRANGLKVRNLTISVGQKPPFNMRFSSYVAMQSEEGKYPGAFVFPPKKGPKISKLSVDERIKRAKLLCESKNMDPSDEYWLTVTDEEKKVFNEIIDKYGATCDGKTIEEIKDKYPVSKQFQKFLAEENGRPIIGLDFSSLYPSIIRAYNFSPDYCVKDKKLAMKLAETNKIIKVDFIFAGKRCVGYFVWHDNNIDPAKPNFKFGVYPYILDSLFNKRKMLKKPMTEAKHKKEQMNVEGNTDSELYDDVCFKFNYYNSKQSALKVFMNTFYGVAGNKKSAFFMLEVAGGVTQYGKENIQLGFRTVKNLGCNVYYGDTDSIYLSVPEKAFLDVDKLYYTNKINKLEYWHKLVEISFKEIKTINKIVDETFEKNNGTKYLAMAYEEVLYPVVFAAKKKYYGIAHENYPNFEQDELFIRGLEIKKRGVSNLLKTIFSDIMWTSMSPDNVYQLIELVTMKIDEIYRTKWDFDQFIQTGVYRPSKNNVAIKTFVRRMKEEYNIDVKPNERFEYVNVKKYPYKYDIRGNKEELKVGDFIELVDNAKKHNMEINLDHYMSGSINGQLARLIAYHDQFYVKPYDDTDESLKDAEETIYKNACKYIDAYTSRYMAKYNQLGKTFQKIYKTTNIIFKECVKNHDPEFANLFSDSLSDFYKFADEQKKCADKEADKIVINTIKKDIEKQPYKQRHKFVNDKLAEYIKLLGTKTALYKSKRQDLCTEFSNLQRDIDKMMDQYSKGIGAIVNDTKSEAKISEDLFKPRYNEEVKGYHQSNIDVNINENKIKEKASQFVKDILNNPTIEKALENLVKIKKEIYANELAFSIFDNTRLYLQNHRNLLSKTIVIDESELERLKKDAPDCSDLQF